MSDSPKQFTRREALKRGAVIGGTVLWVTPIVQTLGMGRAFAQTPSDVCIPSCAVSVVEFWQGETRSSGPITDSNRTDETTALGSPDGSFFSLGYEGWIVLELGTSYYEGKNGEALVIETTFGAPSYPLEKAEVLVSDIPNPVSWHSIGYATNQNLGPNPTKTTFDLDILLGPNEIVRFVKLVDKTLKSDHVNDEPTGSSDAFDVDAVCIACRGPQ